MVRGQVLSLRQRLYIEATQALGFSQIRVLFRHIIPNITGTLVVLAVSGFGSAILIESGLSFLGLGVELGTPTWGRMVYEGYTFITFDSGKWLAIFPGFALSLLVLAVNLLGNGIRDALGGAQTFTYEINGYFYFIKVYVGTFALVSNTNHMYFRVYSKTLFVLKL